MSAEYKAVDRDAMDSYRLELLRRRIVVMAVTIGVILIGVSVLSMLIVRASERPTRAGTLSPGIGGVVLILAALLKMRFRVRSIPLRELLLRSTLMVVLTVMMQIPSSAITARAIEQALRNAGFVHVQIGSLVPLLISMLCVHLAASIIVPWSLWESARPVIIIVIAGLCASPWSPDPLGATFGGLVIVALMGVPGMLVSWLRYSQLRQTVQVRWLSGRYDEVQRELAFARRLHERLFAKPIAEGPVRFDYRYEPMREIGGDFVDVIRESSGALTLILVDVTGHGVAAALAVNRLHGEIKRIVAAGEAGPERAGTSKLPLQIIAAINAYVSLTLSDEGVFATAIAIRIDPNGNEITWCNAGHPPAFVMRQGGQLEPLNSTAMMLGPLGPELFDGELCSIGFGPYDRLFAYTDGAIECRDSKSNELGIEGLRAAFETAPKNNILDHAWQSVQRFRHGPTEDDVLILQASLGVSPSVTSRRQDVLAESSVIS